MTLDSIAAACEEANNKPPTATFSHLPPFQPFKLRGSEDPHPQATPHSSALQNATKLRYESQHISPSQLHIYLEKQSLHHHQQPIPLMGKQNK